MIKKLTIVILPAQIKQDDRHDAVKPEQVKTADPASAGKQTKKRRRSSTESGPTDEDLCLMSAELAERHRRHQELIASCRPESTWREAQMFVDRVQHHLDHCTQPRCMCIYHVHARECVGACSFRRCGEAAWYAPVSAGRM